MPHRSVLHPLENTLKTPEIFLSGSQHEIFEYMRVHIPNRTSNSSQVWRSRALWLLHSVIGVLVHLRETQAVNIDCRLIRESMKLEYIRELCKLNIPENLLYEIKRYLSRLPVNNEETVHGYILEQFNMM